MIDIGIEAGLVIWRGYKALASDVLVAYSVWAPVEEQTNADVVAAMKSGWLRELRVYIGAVAGQRHDNEWQAILEHGCKVPPEIAFAIFPRFKDCRYAL